jgi:hypothetical protein
MGQESGGMSDMVRIVKCFCGRLEWRWKEETP